LTTGVRSGRIKDQQAKLDKNIPCDTIAIRLDELEKIKQSVAEWLAWKKRAPDIVALPKEV
jgi:hypothetical protein